MAKKKINTYLSRDPVNGVPWYAWVKKLEDRIYLSREVSKITGLSIPRVNQFALQNNVKKIGRDYVWDKNFILLLVEKRRRKEDSK